VASFPVLVNATIRHSTTVLVEFFALAVSFPVPVDATIRHSTTVLVEFFALAVSFPVLVNATIRHSTAVLVVDFLRRQATESLYFMLFDFNKSGLFCIVRFPTN
jgi:hypothetical protein